jgi:hypothetical protein
MIFGLVLVGSLSIAFTLVLYWFLRAVFNVDLQNTFQFGLMVFVFGMVFWAMASTSTLQERGARILQNWFDSRLEHFELRTRYELRLFLFRIGMIVFLGTVLFAFFGTLAGQQHMLYIDLFFVGPLLILVSHSLISDTGIALLFLKKFRNDKNKDNEDLRHGLQRYNRSIRFHIAPKRLSAIAQYAMHVYHFKLEECQTNIENKLDEIIQSLENKQYGQIPDALVQLSADCDSYIKKYSGLGIEIKPSLWIRAKENVSSSLLKVLPQLFWLLILIAIYTILRTFIPIQLSFP